MTTPLQRLIQTAQRHRNVVTAPSVIPYATMHLKLAALDHIDHEHDQVALYVSMQHYPESSPHFDAETQQATVQWDSFGLQWRDKNHALVRIGTASEPLDEDVIETARDQGVLVFFIDETHLTPDHFAVFHAAHAV